MTQILFPNKPEVWKFQFQDASYDAEFEDGDTHLLLMVTDQQDLKFTASKGAMEDDFKVIIYADFDDSGISIAGESQLFTTIKSTSMPSFFKSFKVYLEDCNGLISTYSLKDIDIGSDMRFSLKAFVTDKEFNTSYVTRMGFILEGPREPRNFSMSITNYSLSSAPTPKYITPQEVIGSLQLYDNKGELLRASPQSAPTYDQWCQWIVEGEQYCEEQTRRAWAERRKKDEILNLESVPNTGGTMSLGYLGTQLLRTGFGIASEAMLGPGIQIKLRYRYPKDLDSEKGDKLEIRWLRNDWLDITNEKNSYWFDHVKGILYLRRMFVALDTGVRITYRYGEETVPEDIKRAVTLFVGKQFYSTDRYRSIFPTAPEFETKAMSIQQWTWDIDRILKNYTESVVIGGL